VRTISRSLAFLVGVLVLSVSAAHAAAPPTGESVVRQMDAALTFKTRVADAALHVTRDGKTETRTLRMWSRGWDDTYSEFLTPARDKGVKYLKLEKSLYMFLPGTEKVVKIAGHLLRQSVMDSDFSYEDMLETRAQLEDYDAKVLGEEKQDGIDCWIVDLTAKRPDVTYARRKTWIAKDSFVPLRAERYASSGLLLKVVRMSELVEVGGGRRYPARMVMEDQSRNGSRSELHFTGIQIDVELPDETFSRRRLGRP
jgi:outer membrane lipoprotein-sorting protein